MYLGYNDDQIQWGPHDSIPLIAPVDGTVTLYTSPTPLGVLSTMGGEYQQQYKALFDGWVCHIEPQEYAVLGVNPLSQVMNVAVFMFDTPINGVRGIGLGHVRNGTLQGHMLKGTKFGESGASGIQFERAGITTARAAHVHATTFMSGQLSPNGDADGKIACEIMGWQLTDVGFVPGPTHYFSGNYCAGRLLSDFRNASKPVPRVAPD